MKITYQPERDGRAAYDVLSDSGKMYRVRYAGSGDGDPEFIALWSCDCPAGNWGRCCKHVRAVVAVANAEPLAEGV